MRFEHGAGPRTGPGHAGGGAPGLLGCVLGVLLLPVVALSSLVLVGTTWWRLRKLRRQLEASGSRAPQVSPHSERETALCSFVRGLALDPAFTREEALESAVLSSGGLQAAELLDEAALRGWVETHGDTLSVTAAGRDAAERYLRTHGL